MRTDAAARRWAETWQRGWEALDTELVLTLYADGALLSTEPFRAPFRGRGGVRDYVSRVFAEEQSPRVWMAPIVTHPMHPTPGAHLRGVDRFQWPARGAWAAPHRRRTLISTFDRYRAGSVVDRRSTSYGQHIDAQTRQT
jgi:hypothetical protein